VPSQTSCPSRSTCIACGTSSTGQPTWLRLEIILHILTFVNAIYILLPIQAIIKSWK
jgi:hypothetical protein